MKPEREAYARMRIQRLRDKIEELDQRIVGYGSRTITDAEHAECTALIKQRASSRTAIKRWVKELRDAGLTP